MRLRSEAGQAAALTAVFMTVLLGSCAAVLDVGSWFREDRDTQRIADAAALAGAQALPESTGDAQALALEYADKNGGGITAGDITFSSTVLPNDTIRTELERPAPGFFARLFGMDSITVGSHAKARAGVPTSARWVAPITVSIEHPMVSCRGRGLPCFDEATQIDLIHLHGPHSGDAAGAFGLLNLDRSESGAPGTETLAGWMMRGFSGWMDIGEYRSAPSALFNSSAMAEAITERIRVGEEVLFPIYNPPIRRGGSNAEYDIIGWIGFTITSFDNRGSSGWVRGSFTRVVWEGIPSTTPSTPDFGVRSVTLID
jgi:Putative Flp pilus-assembly TadE/G-like